VATFDLKDYPKLHQHFGYHNVLTSAGNHLFCQGLRLSPMLQRREGLLNCALWLSESVKPDDPWSAVKRLLVGKPSLHDATAILANPRLFATGLHRYLILRRNMPRKVESLKLSCIVEQQPDPASRIMLAERVDRNGVPLSRIDWRVNRQEQHTVRRAAELTADGLTRLGLQRPVLDGWVRNREGFPPSYQDNAHPSGTTRMSAAPSSGVVDEHCQVHGIRGLYVAGSSVFPTCSHANPTQMIVALAVRLADTLKRQHRAAGLAAHIPTSLTLARVGVPSGQEG
jgi:GMC oxidoreductase